MTIPHILIYFLATLEHIVANEVIAHNEHFLLFVTMFSTLLKVKLSFMKMFTNVFSWSTAADCVVCGEGYVRLDPASYAS